MTPGIIAFTVWLAFACGASIGFVAGYFFRKGGE